MGWTAQPVWTWLQGEGPALSENRTPVVQTVICEYLRSHGHPTSVVLQPPPLSAFLAPFIFRRHACFRYSFMNADLSVGPDNTLRTGDADLRF